MNVRIFPVNSGRSTFTRNSIGSIEKGYNKRISSGRHLQKKTVIAGCAGVFFVVKYSLRFLRSHSLILKLPGPPTIPFLGNLLDFMCDDVTCFRNIRHWGRAYAPIYQNTMTIFYSSVNISGAEEFEAVASTMKNIQKSFIYSFLSRWLGEGLLTSTGTKWQTRRKILTPAFHFNILQQFVSIFNKETERLIDVLKNETENPSTNVIPLISKFTLYTIAETSMGTKLNLATKEDKQYVNSILKIAKLFFRRLKRPWLYISWIYYKLSSVGRRELKLINTLHNFTSDIIAKRAENFKKFEVDENDCSYPENKKLVFLDLLLNAKMNKGNIDDEGIQDEVNTFMFEGFDTTSASICFTLMLFANHPMWQEMAYQEILQVLGDPKKNPSIKDLNEMKIMERFIKESLRLYPSVPFIARSLEEETMVGGHLLPKDVTVSIHIYDIHRNPKYWKDPDTFDPDRFLPDNCVNRHPFAYVPFSAGPRNCIGQKFAMLELKAVFCGILKNFVLKPVDTPENVKLIPELVLRTETGSLKVKFRSREK